MSRKNQKQPDVDAELRYAVSPLLDARVVEVECAPEETPSIAIVMNNDDLTRLLTAIARVESVYPSMRERPQA